MDRMQRSKDAAHSSKWSSNEINIIYATLKYDYHKMTELLGIAQKSHFSIIYYHVLMSRKLLRNTMERDLLNWLQLFGQPAVEDALAHELEAGCLLDNPGMFLAEASYV